jgi:putative membrane-bound dehydrogenase-like protein
LVFERLTLATEFSCEGASFADLDRDGSSDVIAGPWWYRGPDFGTRFELAPPAAPDPSEYSEHFFAWPGDFDGDGWTDVLAVGFPGRQARWLRNPLGGGSKPGEHWKSFEVHPCVDNESPAFADLTGDGKPELVFHTAGRFGYAQPVGGEPFAPWVFRPLHSDAFEIGPFTHGLGVGDVDGDGRTDVLWNQGWFRHPPSDPAQPKWEFHPYRFSAGQGGAQMFVRDLDRDGDGDVLTSLNAHGFGLSWFENVREGAGVSFVEHPIMTDRPETSAGGVCFSEAHALEVADVDGDGLDDIVTGKRWWSHGAKGDPQPGSPAVVALFRQERRLGRVTFQPQVIDDMAGVGVQLTSGDVDGDGLLDLVIGSKRGVFALVQRRLAPAELASRAGRNPSFDFEEGGLRGWTAQGDAFALQPVRGDTVTARNREASLHQGEYWIGGYERLGDGPKGTLTSSAFTVSEPWASFLVGGGASPATRAELVLAQENRVVFRSSGADYESMQRVVVDLRAYVGRKLFLRLVDDASGGWGHLNFDDFRFHGQRPSFERAQGVPEILPLDPVDHAGLSGPQAARAMTVPPGFQVDLIAAEPELHQPIALTVDDRGRLWVAEAFAYPQRRDGDAGPDDIVVFEDADGDGRFERRTVFLEGLNLVSGLEVGFGGVWIGAAPYLLFVPDRDGDLVPDGPAERLLDGWGYEDTHETLNAFQWGPDGWLYGCHGVFTHSKVGLPGASEAERTPLNAGVWRYHPTRHRFEVFAWGTSNPWGLDFDGRGQAFLTACVIPHLFHAVQGGRYIRQAGAHFQAHTFADIDTIADHRHYVGAQPHSGNYRSGAAGGGHAHCGLILYGESSFPERYRGALLFANIHGNRINQDLLERRGSGFVGRHAPDFLVARDQWFRGINLRSGPDGSLYLIDWYDAQACHLKRTEAWDRTNGRLYRISYGPPRSGSVDLAQRDSAELAAYLGQEPEWHARRARRILQERGRNAGLEQDLRQRLRRSAGEVTHCRALWALHGMGGLDEAMLRELLASPHEFVRAWSVQLALEDRQVEPATLAAFEELALRDPSPVVRLYLASALQRLPLEQRFELGARLADHAEDERDPNLPLLIWYGVEPLVGQDTRRALERFARAPLARVAQFAVRRAAAASSLHGELVRTLSQAEPAALPWMLDAALAGLADLRGSKMPPGWPALHERLVADERAGVRAQAQALAAALGDPQALAMLRAKLADRERPANERVAALDALVRAQDERVAPLLGELLGEPALRSAVLRALGTLEQIEGARAALALYGEMSLEERRETLNALSSRASHAALLLDALESGALARAELGAFVARKLESLKDPAISRRLQELWGRVQPTSQARSARIEELARALTPAVLARADLRRGRELFARTCQQCHTLFEVGGKLGPDLTGSNRSDLAYLLSNVLDPNAVVGKDYQATLVWTRDGRLVTGIQRAANDTSVTLQSESETVVIAREDIEELRISELSTMPEGLLDALGTEEIRDLIAYVQGTIPESMHPR